MRRSDLRHQLAPVRLKFLFIAAIGIAFFVTTADVAVKILYYARYQSATWMLPLLAAGSAFSTLALLNELTLLGFGKPNYGAFSNGVKLVFLLVGLPLGVGFSGVFGGVLVIALSDLLRYVPALVGQRREHFSFSMQDLFYDHCGVFVDRADGVAPMVLGILNFLPNVAIDLSWYLMSIRLERFPFRDRNDSIQDIGRKL